MPVTEPLLGTKSGLVMSGGALYNSVTVIVVGCFIVQTWSHFQSIAESLESLIALPVAPISINNAKS
jgi:hypothetical protein